jgi:3-oxoacyl-[acyl-carrier-protein] synthase III
MHSVFINSIGKFLPGAPIGNSQMEDYLGKINGKASKVKARILKSNGIQTRHYAIDTHQQTRYSNSQMAAHAIRDALGYLDLAPADIDLLAAATTWPDLLVPGFASMVHGELPELPALEISSHQGVCCAGVSALKYAAAQIALGDKHAALAVAAEFPSRLFKSTHFEAQTAAQTGQLGFDTEFLRWMLSDGAGACLLQNRPNPQGLSLKLEWIELVSHANAYPVCMYAGSKDETATKSWMDYPSYAEAAAAGAINLRQNIRLLDNVIKLGVEGWLKLIDLGRVKPDDIDWLLCHYSSHFFRGQIVELLEKAGCMVPEEKWFTNLYTRGNTGCASIYLMLEELLHSDKLQPGQKIFCFVPESGRFTTAYMMLTVVGNNEITPLTTPIGPHPKSLSPGRGTLTPAPSGLATLYTPVIESRPAPHEPPPSPQFWGSKTTTANLNSPRIGGQGGGKVGNEVRTDLCVQGSFSLGRRAGDEGDDPAQLPVDSIFVPTGSMTPTPLTPETPMTLATMPIADPAVSAELLRQLATLWLGFERELRSVPLIRKLHRGDITLDDYLALLRNLRPQVVEGARWIARAASNMTDFQLRSTFIGHAQDEHRDYQMLERNYVSSGGALADIVNAPKNIGSEALSAFIFHQASQPNPVDLIGSMFIIEGLGNQLAAQWAQQLQQTLHLSNEQVSFLAYHGANDAAHLGKLNALVQADWMTADIAERILKTAKVTARLYRLQLEEIDS